MFRLNDQDRSIRLPRPSPQKIHMDASGNMLRQALALLQGHQSLVLLDPHLPAQFKPILAHIPPNNHPSLFLAGSGSSGQFKLIELKLDQIRLAAQASIDYIGLQAHHHWLCCLPFYHIAAVAILFRCQLAEAELSLMPFKAQAVMERLNQGGITHLSLVPTQLYALLQVQKEAPPDLECVLLGGAPADPEWIETALRWGWPLHISYGMTESAAMACAQALSPGEPVHCIGRPLSHMQMEVQNGQIKLNSPCLARYQYTAQGQQSLLDDQGWLLTADQAERDEQGRFYFLGRKDAIIISGGKNIHPHWIEQVLQDCPQLDDIKISAVPDPYWGQKIIAYYRGQISPDALQAWAEKKLKSAYRPKAYYLF